MDAPDDLPEERLLRLGQCVWPLPREPHPCAYLPGRIAVDEAYLVHLASLTPASYQQLMDLNYRRAGQAVYRPRCPGCARCVQLRVPVGEVRLGRSLRRVVQRNRDVRISLGEPRYSPEKHEVYCRYVEFQHPGSPQPRDAESLRAFLYSSCTRAAEVEYRDAAGTLLGVSLLDVASEALSAVYHYFEPSAARRSLGWFSAVAELQLCRMRGVPWYYLGYWVEGSATMGYKARFRPHEVLVDGRWQRVE